MFCRILFSTMQAFTVVLDTKSTELFFSYNDSIEKFEFEFEIPSAYFLWRPVIDRSFFHIVLHILTYI